MIRKSIVAIFLLPCLSPAQSAGSFTGHWRIQGWIGGSNIKSECSFLQRGSILRGRCTSEQGTDEITGQVSGMTVLWSYSNDFDGTPSSFQYAGTLAGKQIKGRITLNPGDANGEFTANLVW